MDQQERDQMVARSINRRRMIRYGLAGGAALLAGCAGGDGGDGGDGVGGSTQTPGGTTGGGDDYSERIELNIAGPTLGFPVEDPIGKTFMETYNVDMSLKSVPAAPSEMIQIFVAGDGQNQYDVIWDNGEGMEDLLYGRGALAPIDSSQIPNHDSMIDAYKEGGYLHNSLTSGGELIGSPSARNADTLGYLKDNVDKPESWGAIFDDEHAGRTAILDDYSDTPHWTALYLRENDRSDVHNADLLTDDQWDAINNIEGNRIDNLEPAQIEAVVDYLIGQKDMGQFRSIWSSFGNVNNMFINGEVDIGYLYPPSIPILENEGVNIGYPALREGNQEWDDPWFLTKGGKGTDGEIGFYRLATYSLTPEYGAKMMDTRLHTTGVPIEDCLAYMEENDWSADRIQKNRQRFELTQSRFDANGPVHSWTNPGPDHLDTYLEEWNRFLNA